VKSRFTTPVVTTAMLPTVVPEGTEKVRVRTVLTEPIATAPKFWLAKLPVELICAFAVRGSAIPADRKSEKEMRAGIGENSLLPTNAVAAIVKAFRLGWCIAARIAVSARGGLRLSI